MARKLDPLFNSEMINNIDQSIFGLYSTSTNFIEINCFLNRLECHLHNRLPIIAFILGKCVRR